MSVIFAALLGETPTLTAFRTVLGSGKGWFKCFPSALINPAIPPGLPRYSRNLSAEGMKGNAVSGDPIQILSAISGHGLGTKLFSWGITEAERSGFMGALTCSSASSAAASAVSEHCLRQEQIQRDRVLRFWNAFSSIG